MGHNPTSYHVVVVLERAKVCLEGIIERKLLSEQSREEARKLLIEIEEVLGYEKRSET